MRNLIIVESPTKVKVIKKMLDKNDDVVSTRGHIMDLRKYGKYWLGVDLDDNFKPMYQTMKDKKEVVKELANLSKKADNVLIATDPDREGEAIANNVRDVIHEEVEKLSDDHIKRIRFNEITKKAVNEAIENPTEINEQLVRSQQARRVVDRIIGFKLSGLLRKKIKAESAGRVQSVALRLIVEREIEREKFVPVKYFTIDVTLEDKVIASYHGKDGKESLLTSEKEKEEILKEIETNGLKVLKIEEKILKQKPPKPLKTSTLIQRASSLFGYTAASTMFVAQQLYEGIEINGETTPLISYIRTDSTKISDESKKNIASELNKRGLAKGIVKEAKKGKFEQGAHEAIRPIDTSIPFSELKGLTKQQLNIYKMIWYYTMTSQMEHSETKNTNYVFDVKGHQFLLREREVLKEGFKKLLNELSSSDTENVKPSIEFKEGEFYQSKETKTEAKETQPPKRYSISSLVKKLEDLGIGRPSTYSTIIKTLKFRNYINIESKAFIPTKKGRQAVEALIGHFNEIINEKYTATVEKDLDQVAEGNLTYEALVREFYNHFEELFKKAEIEMKVIPLEKTGEKCPDCEADLVIRNGRFGEFVGCSDYPKCKYIKKTKKEPKLVGRNCPDCNSALVERASKRGTFIGCSKFPKCKYTEYPKK